MKFNGCAAGSASLRGILDAISMGGYCVFSFPQVTLERILVRLYVCTRVCACVFARALLHTVNVDTAVSPAVELSSKESSDRKNAKVTRPGMRGAEPQAAA